MRADVRVICDRRAEELRERAARQRGERSAGVRAMNWRAESMACELASLVAKWASWDNNASPLGRGKAKEVGLTA